MILITGATGFLGTELVYQLTQQGIRLRALKRKNSIVPPLLKNNELVEWVVADVNDLAALEDVFEGITQVYHCAALVSFHSKDKKSLLKINIEGTSNIVNLCLEFKARLVHVSSVAALGNAKKGAQITENDYWEYDSKSHSYAISKYEGEMEVWRGIAEGLDAVIVNPSIIIGANAGFEGSGAIFKLIKGGLSFFTKGTTGIVDVVDVAKCMILLMNSKESGSRFIISAENYSYKQFFEEIARGFGIKAPSKEATPLMMGIAWRVLKLESLFTGKTASLTRDAAISSLKSSSYSNEKIKKTIEIEFKPLNQSILQVCERLHTLPQ